MQGKIRKIIPERGFGFILTEKGDDVEFEMVVGEKGLMAVSVRPPKADVD
jgi:cold shock CspA family protein